jgi:hypothetical protein
MAATGFKPHSLLHRPARAYELVARSDRQARELI